jgi:hypothetical protein
MTKILCNVAEAYPQQVLVVLRTTIWPELITQRIKFGKFFEIILFYVAFLVQERLPLISDWIRCAPSLDITGGNAPNEQLVNDPESGTTVNPYEQLQAIQKLEKHEEQVYALNLLFA